MGVSFARSLSHVNEHRRGGERFPWHRESCSINMAILWQYGGAMNALASVSSLCAWRLCAAHVPWKCATFFSFSAGESSNLRPQKTWPMIPSVFFFYLIHLFFYHRSFLFFQAYSSHPIIRSYHLLSCHFDPIIFLLSFLSHHNSHHFISSSDYDYLIFQLVSILKQLLNHVRIYLES